MPDLGLDTEGLASWLSQNLLVLVVLVVCALIVMRVGRGLLARILHRTLMRNAIQAGIPPELAEAEVAKRARTLETLLFTILRWVVVGVVVLILLALFDLVGVIAALGLVFAAIAFAGQDVIRDYLNGMLIVLENQYGEGDVVRIAGVSGTVELVTLRRTQLRDLDGGFTTSPTARWMSPRTSPGSTPASRRVRPRRLPHKRWHSYDSGRSDTSDRFDVTL